MFNTNNLKTDLTAYPDEYWGSDAKTEAVVCNRILTCREVEILQLIAGGCSIRVLAAELFVSENTIKTHRNNIIKKMNAANMPHAIAVALRNKIIK